MNIYFACSITGGRQDEEAYQVIVQTLTGAGHTVPTAHLSLASVLELEASADPQEVYTRDVNWINTCHALIAEVSTPSHGVGYEIAYALGRGKPVFCCYRATARVSKMITGNTEPGLRQTAYHSVQELRDLIQTFTESIAPHQFNARM